MDKICLLFLENTHIHPNFINNVEHLKNNLATSNFTSISDIQEFR